VIADPGYAVVESVFAEAEIAPAATALDGDLSARSRAGARHVLALPEVRALAADPRMLALAAGFIGAARPFRATLFDKSPSANWLVVWHQDTALPMRAQVDAPGWGPWSTKAGTIYAHAPASALVEVDERDAPARPPHRVRGDDELRSRPGLMRCVTLRESSRSGSGAGRGRGPGGRG
jgi:hypothetical protein